MDAASDRQQPVRVWDLPTRVFHWVLAATVIAAFVTAKIGDSMLVWHMRLGLLVLALLAFRLVWGFVGGHWSRFGAFLYGPSSVLAYLRGDPGPQRRHEVGHSPLGAWSVFALLGVLAAQVATGLVADDEVATTGPLNRFVQTATALKATGWHTSFGQYLVVSLVLLHIGAVLFYRWRKQVDLIGPMWHGDKALAAGTPASADGTAQRALAALLVVLALALSWWIARLGS